MTRAQHSESISTSRMADLAVGIDLGTTNTCVCIFWRGHFQVIGNGHGNKTTPSYVTFDEYGDVLVGDASRDGSFANPKHAIFGIKRILGRRYHDAEVQKNRKRWPFTVVNREGLPVVAVEQVEKLTNYSPAEISSQLLKYIRDTVKNFTGHEVTEAVITVPANFTNAQRRATEEAGILAGLSVVRMINEPTAAALAYGLEKLDGEKIVMVYDFGGGTLDVAILKVINGKRFETLATAANMNLGGEDFDQKLLERFVQEFKDKNNGIDLSDFPEAVTTLRLTCDKAKKSLSAMSALAHVSANRIYENRNFKTRVTRAEFEKLCEDVFAKILEPVERALRQARMNKADIEHIVLVGGCSRMPKVQEILQNFFVGQKLHLDINPDEAIAHGAAVYARLLITDPEYSNLDMQGHIRIIEATPHSLGVELPTGEFATVVPRGTPIPFEMVRNGTTYKDNQSFVQIKLFEGKERMAQDNEFLGAFTLDGIAPARAGIPRITLTLSSDAVGCLIVTAIDERDGRTNVLTVNFDR